MRSPDCSHPMNRLLPFYLNGSLEVTEETSVREHLDTCEDCSRELVVLAQVAEGVRREDWSTPPQASSGISPFGAGAAGLAAGLAIASLVALTWYLSRPAGAPADEPSARGVPEAIQVASILDLQGGPLRGDMPVATLALDPRVEVIVIRLRIPITDGGRPTLELQDPGGRRIVRDAAPLSLDPLGTADYAFPAGSFTRSGRYELVLRVAAGTPDTREFRYPFLVEPADGREPRD